MCHRVWAVGRKLEQHRWNIGIGHLTLLQCPHGTLFRKHIMWECSKNTSPEIAFSQYNQQSKQADDYSFDCMLYLKANKVYKQSILLLIKSIMAKHVIDVRYMSEIKEQQLLKDWCWYCTKANLYFPQPLLWKYLVLAFRLKINK